MIFKEKDKLDIHFISNRFSVKEKKEILKNIPKEDIDYFNKQLTINGFIMEWCSRVYNTRPCYECKPIIKVNIYNKFGVDRLQLEMYSITGKSQTFKYIKEYKLYSLY